VVRDQLPREAREALQALRAEISRRYDTLVRVATTIDPTIEKPIHNLGNQALVGTEEVEKRLVNHLKKRQATETQQIARARELVLPLGRPQERVVTVAPWLARYGPALLTDLAAVILDWYRAGLEASLEPS
jgi:uncharacterized protein YllA (UPF0747 family)